MIKLALIKHILCGSILVILASCNDKNSQQVATNHIRREFNYYGQMDFLGRSEINSVESVEVFKINKHDFGSRKKLIETNSVSVSEADEFRRAKRGLDLSHLSDKILTNAKLLGVIRMESCSIIVFEKDDGYLVFHLTGV